MFFFNILHTLAAVALAAPPPSTCDPELINDCIDRFEERFNTCNENDLRCQCNSVIKDGASCYSACPQEALTRFIQTYNDGKCANFDPYISKRDESQALELGDVVDAITITPSDPTTTISLSPQEYQSRLEKQMYKENLRSIRSERARISREADEARNRPQQAVNKQESMAITSAPSATASLHTTASPTSKSHNKADSSKQNKQKNSANAVLLPAPLLLVGLLL